MREFLGIGGYQRPAEGYFSREHLTFATFLVFVMIATAVFIGIRNRNSAIEKKNRILVITAITLDTVEILKIILICIRNDDPFRWLYELPLFLCSMQMIALPLAAFSKSRIKEAALDFVFIFGLLGALMGTYFAGNNYSCYPVISIDNVASGITHCISGFASLYIGISQMASMKRKNVSLCIVILSAFCLVAYGVNHLIDYNYMFLVRGDGTPYDIIYNLVGGNPVLYPLSVVALFLLYIAAFYGVYYLITRKRKA